MSTVPSSAAGVSAILCGAGRFVAYFRNRAIGFEAVRADIGAAGRLRVRADTEIALPRFSLRQSVTAEFAADLAPRWCTLEAAVNARTLSLAVEIGRERAVVACRSGKDSRSSRHDLARPPLLLIDNCFVTHALAAVAAEKRAPSPPVFHALPACQDLAVERSPGLKVLLGGREYAPPALSLRLAPDLDEHVWFQDAWIERLIIPQTQMRVEWRTTLPSTGGPS